MIPAHTNSAAGTVLYAQGPIAIVHFNTDGFPTDDMGMMLPGLLFALVSGLLMALGLSASGAASFADRARLVVCFALGVTSWTILAQPVFNHFGWGYWIYSFIAESTGLILAGLVIARWFVAAPEAAARRAEPVAPAEARAGSGNGGRPRNRRGGRRAPSRPRRPRPRSRPAIARPEPPPPRPLQVDAAFRQRERDHHRAADRHQMGEAGKREGVAGEHRVAKPVDRRLRLLLVASPPTRSRTRRRSASAPRRGSGPNAAT